MFANGRGEILALDKPHILAPRITEHVAESMHPSATLGGEGNVVGRKVHLALNSRASLKPLHGSFRRVWPHCAQMFLYDSIAALKAESLQFLVQTHRRQVRIALQQLRDLIHIRIQQTGPPRARFQLAGSPILVLL